MFEHDTFIPSYANSNRPLEKKSSLNCPRVRGVVTTEPRTDSPPRDVQVTARERLLPSAPGAWTAEHARSLPVSHRASTGA
jgi:hypothetical protein